MTGPYDFIDPDRPERKRAVQRTNEATETEKGGMNTDRMRFR